MNETSRTYLQTLFDRAVAAAHPTRCLPPHLPVPPATGRLVMLAAGKAAAAMTAVAEQHYLPGGFEPARIAGLAVTRRGYGYPTRHIPVIEAGHPVPDAAGLAATLDTLALAEAAASTDLILVLLSGGASANWIAPAPGLTLSDKQAVTRALIKSGASIAEINAVRKHLSRIKGGWLAQRAHPAPVVTLAISDVPGDDPSVIGSGPTVPDPTTLAEARAIVARYRLALPAAVAQALSDPGNETPKPGDRVFATTSSALVARPATAFAEVERAIQVSGRACIMLGTDLQGQAREVAAEHARLARQLRSQGRHAVILSGGELTVTIRGTGRGGPSQEYALALALALDSAPGISALAGDTDGTDGGGGEPDDPAGAFIDETTLARARALGLDPALFLEDNNSTEFFNRLGDLLSTGPTHTNINDFRAILVDSP